MSTYFSLPIKAGPNKGGRGNSNLNPYEKHKQLIQRYQALKPTPIAQVSDLDILRKSHKFLRDHEQEENMSWEDRLAKKYYDKLFKEYCLGDFSRYKTGVVGLRWRTRQECVDGKGHFSCGNLKCALVMDLSSWEVNFAYLEQGEKKNALVKIRLCPDCSYKLNYKKLKAEKKQRKRQRATEEDEASEENGKEEKKICVESLGREQAMEGDSPPVDKDKKSSDDAEENAPEELNIWAAPLKLIEGEAKSKEQEMDEYLQDLFS